MNLQQLIDQLEQYDPHHQPLIGFRRSMSNRGHYNTLAFEAVYDDVTVGDMLETARQAVQSEYEGWKGGEYVMDMASHVYLAKDSSRAGWIITPLFLGLMMGNYAVGYEPELILSQLLLQEDAWESKNGDYLAGSLKATRDALQNLRKLDISGKLTIPDYLYSEMKTSCFYDVELYECYVDHFVLNNILKTSLPFDHTICHGQYLPMDY